MTYIKKRNILLKTNYAKDPKGIYIHIPFCISKCSYCSFYSLEHLNENIQKKYIIQLNNEIKRSQKSSRDNIQTLYFGGGTPSILKPELISSTLKTIEESFNIPIHNLQETTIEVNPGTVDINKLNEYKKMGFNRLSIGIQTLNNELLRRINRIHTEKQAIRTIEDAIKAGFNNISVDLMFGLPGQTLKDIEDTINKLDYDEVKHVSAYSLSIEPGTPFEEELNSGKITLPEETVEREMQYFINKALYNRGFNHYEISNYAKDGFEARHNTLYWNMDGYYGFGAGASGFINNQRVENSTNLNHYLEDFTKDKNIHNVSIKEAKGDFMFLGLRQLKGISDKDYRKLFNSSFFTDYKEEIKCLQKNNLIKQSGDTLYLTDLGMDLANQVFLEFV